MILFCTDATRWHTRPCTATESNLIYGWHGSGPKPTVTTGITKWFNGRSEPTEGNEIPTSSLTLLHNLCTIPHRGTSPLSHIFPCVPFAHVSVGRVFVDTLLAQERFYLVQFTISKQNLAMDRKRRNADPTFSPPR